MYQWLAVDGNFRSVDAVSSVKSWARWQEPLNDLRLRLLWGGAETAIVTKQDIRYFPTNFDERLFGGCRTTQVLAVVGRQHFSTRIRVDGHESILAVQIIAHSQRLA